MQMLMFVLSGEHQTLPYSEVTASLKAERKKFNVIEQLDQLILVQTKADANVMASRLAMCKEICLHICTSEAREREIFEAVGSSDIADLIPHGKSFAVRINRVKRSAAEIDTIDLSRKLAGMIASEIEFKVNLDNPDVELLGVLTGDKCVFGITAARVERGEFTKRRPIKRPAFHPSTLPPTLARCMVNLARTSRDSTLLDPFCGVGGILLEGGLIGAKLVGVDIEREMVDGARRNLEANGLTDFQLMVGDARKLQSMEVDAIATDPPYGRQATTGGAKLDELYREALPSMASALKAKGHICVTTPAELELEDLAADVGLRKIERHEQRVHRSLTRSIYVFRK